MNIRRIISALAFSSFVTLICAQSSISDTIYTTTLGNVASTEVTVFPDYRPGKLADFTRFDDEHRAIALGGIYTGDYRVDVSIAVTPSSWASVLDESENPTSLTLAGYFNNVSIGSSIVSDSDTYVFTKIISASDILRKTYNVAASYSGFLLQGGQYVDFASSYTITAVPEPSTYALLLGVGTLGLVGWRRFRRK